MFLFVSWRRVQDYMHKVTLAKDILTSAGATSEWPLKKLRIGKLKGGGPAPLRDLPNLVHLIHPWALQTCPRG